MHDLEAMVDEDAASALSTASDEDDAFTQCDLRALGKLAEQLQTRFPATGAATATAQAQAAAQAAQLSALQGPGGVTERLAARRMRLPHGRRS